MVFFTLDSVLRGFPAAAYTEYASPQTLVRPCPPQKILISELDIFKCHNLIADGHYLSIDQVSYICFNWVTQLTSCAPQAVS